MKILAILAILASHGSSFAQDEIFKPTHGGEMVKKKGLGYEVVRKTKEIVVYPPKDKKDAPVPNVIIIKFKNKEGIIDQMELKLLPMREPGNIGYMAPLPTNIYIAGGITFDLSFGKKK